MMGWFEIYILILGIGMTVNMITDRPEKPDEKPTDQQPKAQRRSDIGEIILWLFAFAMLFFVLTYGAIFLIDNTSATLNNPIPLIGGDG